MTVVFAANLEQSNVLLADIFVTEADGRFSTAEKVIPCGWAPDTFIAGLGDELFMLIIKEALADAPKRLGWPPMSSIDLLAPGGIDEVARRANQYRDLLPSAIRPPHQNPSAIYVVNRSAVWRWLFRVDADKYVLAARTPDAAPRGYAFIDAGRCRGAVYVAPSIVRDHFDPLIAYASARSSELPYDVGTGVTGVVLPHDDMTPLRARCLCELTLEERTPKPQPVQPPSDG